MTLDLPDQIVKAVKLLAVHDRQKLSEAVADLLRFGLTGRVGRKSTNVRVDEATLQRRKNMTRKFITGEWGLDLSGYEQARVADRAVARKRGSAVAK